MNRCKGSTHMDKFTSIAMEGFRWIPNAQWRHFPGTENPSDCASRGLLTSQLKKHNLWWHGPVCDNSSWPFQLNSYEEKNLPEAKTLKNYMGSHVTVLITHSIITNDGNAAMWSVSIERQNHESKFTADLISRAKLFWIKETQRVHLHSELIMLKKSQVSRHHVLNRLTAYIGIISDCISGIIRVGGRFHKTQLDHHSKHPAIIPRSSQLTSLIIRHSHLYTR